MPGACYKAPDKAHNQYLFPADCLHQEHQLVPSNDSNSIYFPLVQEHIEEVAEDHIRLAAIAQRVNQLRQEAVLRLAAHGQLTAGVLQQSLERDVQMYEIARRLRQLDRLGPKACLGFMLTDSGERIYIGRSGLRDGDGSQLMVDWRAPAAQPFFSASHAHPEGLAMRRRYRWRAGKIVHYWDEVFDLEQLGQRSSLDEHSAFIASLGAERTGSMQDVLSTIQADQDAIIRSTSSGALVVDGGPGTGKTVVALHRAAFMLYSDARLKSQRGRVLVVSPHDSYSSYVADVLPNLGEEDVLLSTLRQLVSTVIDQPCEGERLSQLKGMGIMVDAVARAVSVFEQPPASGMSIDSSWGVIEISCADWISALSILDRQIPHNDNRIHLKEALIELLVPRTTHDEQEKVRVRTSLEANAELGSLLDEHWPIIEPENLLRALYTTPRLLHYCAPDLDQLQRKLLLSQSASSGWTPADVPLLDAARHYLGDPSSESARRSAVREQQRIKANVQHVVADLVASADDLEDLSSQLRNADLQEQLASHLVEHHGSDDFSAGPFSHVIIDEAQDLSDAQWAMILRRCPSGSLTIVGDRAQCPSGFNEPWADRLARVGISNVRVSGLHINYRTTTQIMEAAAKVIRAELPDANIPRSIRPAGKSVRYGSSGELEVILSQWLSQHPEGTAAIIGSPEWKPSSRVAVLQPQQAKGLEFDFVVVFRPEDYGVGLHGAVQQYVAMTRSTAELVVLSDLNTSAV